MRHEGRTEGRSKSVAGSGPLLARVLVPVALLLSLALVSAHQHADGTVPTDACAVCHAGGATALGTDAGAPAIDGPPLAVAVEAPAAGFPVPRADPRRAPSSRAPPSRPANV